MRDFIPVAPLLNSELVMVVHPSVPAHTVKEFIALAKSKPGALNYASSGVGSNYHMAGELFKTLTGTNIVHVPYKGSAGARNDIISGQVEMMFDSVPTMAQMAQIGLLNREINHILARADVKDSWEKQGATPMLMTPDEFGGHVQSEIEKWAKIIKANGIAPE
jgi:tripartite-type tricarboxylate transporter receptor subunit TctC